MMRLRRFEAPDTTTALAMIRKEMGEDAVILTSRPISGKKNGIKPWIEVVAAMDSDIEALVNTAPRPGAPEQLSPLQADRSTGQPVSIPVQAAEKTTPKPSTDRVAVQPAFGLTLPNDIRSEARELRQRFGKMLKKETEPGPTPTKTPVPPAGKSRQTRPNPVEVARWREQVIGRIKVTPLRLDPERKSPVIIALVGATGVGKTTTAAKLAAWFSLREHAGVALVSMDCYRIGATDQLRTYARIMRLACELALRKKDLAQAIARHSDKDVIIIDTAGKSPYDNRHIAELTEWFAEVKNINPFLLLPATAKKEDLAVIIEAYLPLKPEGLILTKLDETRAYAALCQQVASGDIPVSCVCTGQRVPEDFLPASRDLIEKLFMEGWDATIPEMTSLLREYRL